MNIYIVTNFPISILFNDPPILFPSKNNILILTSSTLDLALKKYQNLAILMYAPWCPYCKSLLPELEKAAGSKRINDMNLTFAKIDIDYYTSIRDKYNIKGLPNIIFFENGEKKEIYDGERRSEFIIEWFYKRLINPIHVIDSLGDINKYQNEKGFNYIYFGNDTNNINIYKNFSMKQDIKFGLCQNLETIKSYGLIEPETAVYYKPFDEPPYVITKNITEDNLQKIIKDNRSPLIYKSYEDLFYHSLTFYKPAFCFFRNSTDSRVKEYDNHLKKLAIKYKGKIKFTIGDFNDKFVQSTLRYYKMYISEDNSPTALIFDFKGDFNTWRFNDFYMNYNESNLEEFLKNWIDKKLASLKFKSEEDPGKQEKGEVFKVVYKTFKRDVLDNKLNVLVKFYMPNDTNCNKIESIYEDLAMKLKINGNIRIAEYNLNENYFDFVKIDHYPTLLYFRAGYKNKDELIEYKGNMDDVNDLIYYVLTNQKFPILNQKKDKKTEEKNTEKINHDL
jgi:protein disulfide isomerase